MVDWIDYQFKIENISKFREIVTLIPRDEFLVKKVYVALREHFEVLDNATLDWYDEFTKDYDLKRVDTLF